MTDYGIDGVTLALVLAGLAYLMARPRRAERWRRMGAGG